MKYRIRDLTTIYRGSSPRPIQDYLSDTGWPWLKISDFCFGDRVVCETKQYIKEIKNTKLVKKGTLVLTNSASPGIPIFLGKDICLHDGFLYFEEISEKLDKNYLFYWLTYYRQNIVNLANGSVFRNLKKEIVENLEIDLPDLKTQKQIVRILSALDKKIELNTRINEYLFNLTMAYFNKLFDKLKEFRRLDEISSVTIGKTPPRTNKECFTKDKDDIKWISISDLGKSGLYIWDTAEKLTHDAVEKYNVKIVPKDTILLSFKLTIGRTGFTTENMATNEAIAHITPTDSSMLYYLYYALSNYNYNNLGSTSSIANAINSKIVKSMRIGVPDQNKLNEFNNLAEPILKTIRNNEMENISLSNIRDTILPKLMSGKISLEDINE